MKSVAGRANEENTRGREAKALAVDPISHDGMLVSVVWSPEYF
jgi:hypothetical protein